MTVAPDRDPVVVEDLDGALAALREAGLRATSARRVVLEALFAAAGPVSAEEIADGLGGRLPRSDLASVYRNLETLEDLGVVRHLHLGHGPGLYGLPRDGEREYLACERCGRVTSVEPARLDPVRRQIEKRFGYRVRFTHFPILGLCARCAGARSARR